MNASRCAQKSNVCAGVRDYIKVWLVMLDFTPKPNTEFFAHRDLAFFETEEDMDSFAGTPIEEPDFDVEKTALGPAWALLNKSFVVDMLNELGRIVVDNIGNLNAVSQRPMGWNSQTDIS